MWTSQGCGKCLLIRTMGGQVFDSQIKEQVLGPEGKVSLIILHDAFCGVNEALLQSQEPQRMEVLLMFAQVTLGS